MSLQLTLMTLTSMVGAGVWCGWFPPLLKKYLTWDPEFQSAIGFGIAVVLGFFLWLYCEPSEEKDEGPPSRMDSRGFTGFIRGCNEIISGYIEFKISKFLEWKPVKGVSVRGFGARVFRIICIVLNLILITVRLIVVIGTIVGVFWIISKTAEAFENRLWRPKGPFCVYKTGMEIWSWVICGLLNIICMVAVVYENHVFQERQRLLNDVHAVLDGMVEHIMKDELTADVQELVKALVDRVPTFILKDDLVQKVFQDELLADMKQILDDTKKHVEEREENPNWYQQDPENERLQLVCYNLSNIRDYVKEDVTF